MRVGKATLKDRCVAIATACAVTTAIGNEFFHADGTGLFARATATTATNAHVYIHVIHYVSLDFFVVCRFWCNHILFALLYPIRLIGL